MRVCFLKLAPRTCLGRVILGELLLSLAGQLRKFPTNTPLSAATKEGEGEDVLK